MDPGPPPRNRSRRDSRQRPPNHPHGDHSEYPPTPPTRPPPFTPGVRPRDQWRPAGPQAHQSRPGPRSISLPSRSGSESPTEPKKAGKGKGKKADVNGTPPKPPKPPGPPRRGTPPPCSRPPREVERELATGDITGGTSACSPRASLLRRCDPSNITRNIHQESPNLLPRGPCRGHRGRGGEDPSPQESVQSCGTGFNSACGRGSMRGSPRFRARVSQGDVGGCPHPSVSLGANSEHGLNRSHVDIRKAVEALIADAPFRDMVLSRGVEQRGGATRGHGGRASEFRSRPSPTP